MAMKSTIDHVIFIVKDLSRSVENYKILLGRNPSWRGSHPAFKTQNALFRLDNTYIELLAEDYKNDGDMENGSTFVSEYLVRKGPGLAGLSFGTTNAANLVTHMQKHGIDALGPMKGDGKDILSGAVRNWLNVFWPNIASRGLWTFGIEHIDPIDTLPLATPDTSALMVTNDTIINAVDHIVINTKDLAAAKNFYGDVLGIRLALELPDHPLGKLMFFKANKMVLEFIHSNNYDKEEDEFWGIAYKTNNVEATRERLTNTGVKVSEIRSGMKPGTRVCTVKSHNLDVPTLLIEPNISK